jgi:hypothetical protein
MSKLMKIRPVGAELFHVVGQTDIDMTQQIVAFRNFANAPKNGLVWKMNEIWNAILWGLWLL